MPLTLNQLENTLVLINASDEAIKSAKGNRIESVLLADSDPQLAILTAAKKADIEFYSYASRQWEASGFGFLREDAEAQRLRADFQRPAITPDDIPAELRTRLEEGLVYGDAGDIEKQVIDHFRHVDDAMECRRDGATGHDDWQPVNTYYMSHRRGGPNPAAEYRFRKKMTYREPGDLPAEMREKLEKGLPVPSMTSMEREVMDFFCKTGRVEVQKTAIGDFGPCVRLYHPPGFYRQFRLRKEKTYREPDERDIDKMVEVSNTEFANHNEPTFERSYVGRMNGLFIFRCCPCHEGLMSWPFARVEDK